MSSVKDRYIREEKGKRGVLVAGLSPAGQRPCYGCGCEFRIRTFLTRKEVIQPHLPVRLPCYDFTPVMKPTVDAVLLAVRQTSSGEPHSHGVTGGVYKTRERIHRGMLIRDY